MKVQLAQIYLILPHYALLRHIIINTCTVPVNKPKTAAASFTIYICFDALANIIFSMAGIEILLIFAD